MVARALICDSAQRFTLEEVLLPEPAPGSMLVRTLRSGVSIGTEFALIRAKISWGPYPLCTGYQAVGIVEQVGDEVAGFAPGDLVYYRDNREIRLADGTAVSAVAGTHASHAVIDPRTTHGCAKLPEGVAPDVGSLFVMPACGLLGADMSQPHFGDIVAVSGAGMIGLGAIATCAHRGAVVIALDVNDERLRVARELGAEVTVNVTREDAGEAVRRLAPAGADVVFEATGIPSCVGPAIELCRTDGRFVWQGNYGVAPLEFHFMPAHGRRLRMFFPCDDGQAPARRAVMRNIASGALKWEKVITHRVEADEAPELYDRINRGAAPDVLGAVVRWSD